MKYYTISAINNKIDTISPRKNYTGIQNNQYNIESLSARGYIKISNHQFYLIKKKDEKILEMGIRQP